MKRGLTGGDAVAVLALLLFILAWSAGWAWSLDATDPDDLDDLGIIDSALLFAAIVWPLFWAGSLVKVIVTDATRKPWERQ